MLSFAETFGLATEASLSHERMANLLLVIRSYASNSKLLLIDIL